MKGFFNTIFVDNIIRLSVLLSVALFLLGIIILGVFYRSLPSLIPVFNQLPWGEERLGPTYFLAIPYAVLFCIGTINMFVAKKMYEVMPLIARIISLTTFFITILVIIFTIRIVLLFI